METTIQGSEQYYHFLVRTTVWKEKIRVSVYRVVGKCWNNEREDGFEPEDLMAHSTFKMIHDDDGGFRMDTDRPALILEHGNFIYPDRGFVIGELYQILSTEIKMAQETIFKQWVLTSKH